jgi:CheY-like chemotaxis protein
MNASSLTNAFLHLFIRPQREFIAAPQFAGASPSAKQSTPGRPARTTPLILIADHDALARQRIGLSLRPAGVEVRHLKSTAECLAAAPFFQPDLILLNLPMMLAENVSAATLRQCADKSGNPPIIFIGGKNDQESLNRVRSYLDFQQRRLKIARELAEVAATPPPVAALIAPLPDRANEQTKTALPASSAAIAHHDLAPVVRLAEWVFQSIATDKQITLKVDAPAAGLLAVCDEIRIQRAIENLLSNAIKYSPAGGIVTLGARSADGWLRVWVDDEGPGVPLDEQDGLFEDAEHFLNIQDADEAGGNRGLVVCRHIAATHHGKMEMHNRREGGAHFELRLPAASAPRVTAAEALSDRPPADKVTPFIAAASAAVSSVNLPAAAVA